MSIITQMDLYRSTMEVHTQRIPCESRDLRNIADLFKVVWGLAYWFIPRALTLGPVNTTVTEGKVSRV